MASNKNQHFVPRCYLRPFSLGGDKVAISLFNLDRSKFVLNAPLKNQCSADYFYGKDDFFEKILQSSEVSYAEVLALIHQPRYCLEEEHRISLLRFWLLQYLRTEAASKRAIEVSHGVGEFSGLSSSEFGLDIRKAVEYAMYTYVAETAMVDDMKLCLLRNRTRIPFITSDDPAVMTNRWFFEDRRVRGLSPGLNSSGALLLLPLSPKVLLMAYDGDVYSIPHNHGWVDIKNERDVEAFNQHQYLNCNANVYFNDLADQGQILSAHASASRLRITPRHRLIYAKFDKDGAGGKRYVVVTPEIASHSNEVLMHIQSVYSIPERWPGQIMRRTNGAVYTNGTGVGYIRPAKIASQRSGGCRREKV